MDEPEEKPENFDPLADPRPPATSVEGAWGQSDDGGMTFERD